MRLGTLLGRAEWLSLAQRTVHAFSDQITAAPETMPLMVSAWQLLKTGLTRVVFVGHLDDPTLITLRHTVDKEFLPHVVQLFADNTVIDRWGEQIPELQEMQTAHNQPMAFVCCNQTCLPAITSPTELKKTLSQQL